MRNTLSLNDHWYFRRGTLDVFSWPCDTSGWEAVTLPHDWAVGGIMSGWNDAKITSEGASPSGETGGLPYQGGGCYTRQVYLPESEEGRIFRLEFDGVMSHARVFVNGALAGSHVYGYGSFAVDVTPYLHFGRVPNIILVEADNPPYLCRWYPGAGIYRNVRLQSLSAEGHFPYNGIQLLTETLDIDRRTAVLRVRAEGIDDSRISVTVRRDGGDVAFGGHILEVADVALWSPEQPALYDVVISMGTDEVTIPYGFRKLEISRDGMLLNGRSYRFKGFCMHHDLGVFGAAFHKPVMRWRLKKIKALGCNALRMAHNPPAPQLLDLCDEMGFLVMDEAFDVWQRGKTNGDYHNEFDQCHEADLRSFIRRDRNHPAVALWSIGNEISEEATASGACLAEKLTRICHEEDPTRLVTAACTHHQAEDNLELHRYLDALDVPGFNYKPALFPILRERFPDKPLLATETSATLSTRGEYIPGHPVETGAVVHASGYPSAYGTEYCTWSNDSEVMFQALEANPWFLGEFAWCTFEYLGEPSPYGWPARSSCFALYDMAGFPKDRAWLYAAKWRPQEMQPVVHILAHWEWTPGTAVPVQVFSSCAEVELYLNGRSLGRQCKGVLCRLDWGLVPFEAGRLEAVGFDENGVELARDVRTTPGMPARICLDAQAESGENGAFVFVDVSLADVGGNRIETAAHVMTLSITGKAELCGVDNGDSHCHLPFKRKNIALFHGRAMITLFVKGPSLLTVSGAHCQSVLELPL